MNFTFIRQQFPFDDVTPVPVVVQSLEQDASVRFAQQVGGFIFASGGAQQRFILRNRQNHGNPLPCLVNNVLRAHH